MSFIIPLQELDQDNIRTAGGKGANLSELTAAGLPVPPGFVLTTTAYDAFVQTHHLQSQIVDLACGVSAADAQLTQDAAEAIKRLFLAADVPLPIRAALFSAYADLATDGGLAVAVRSSASAEDMPQASSAGLHEIYLNVQGQGALLIAVKYCWASLWTAKATASRLTQGIDPAQVSMAVVVQAQIAAEASGVAFSLNPQSNCYDEALINSRFGLGGPVGSGLVTPDTFVVDKVTKENLQKRISAKEVALVALEGGGTQEQPVAAPDSASLTGAQAVEVGELVTRVEDHYGMPVDIEWALADGALYLLQARPIPTYVPLPEIMITQPGEEKYLYLDLILLSQGLQESLSVLGNDIWGRLTETIKGDVGMVDRGMDGPILNIEGRQYLHLSNLMSGLGMRAASRICESYDTPTRSILDTLDLEGYTPAERPEPMRGLRWRSIRHTCRMIPHVIRGLGNPDNAAQEYKKKFARDVKNSQDLAKQEMSFGNLVGMLLEMLKEQMTTTVSLMEPSSIARRQLRKTFRKNNVEELLVALEMDPPGSPTAEMGRQIFTLAQSPEVQEAETGKAFAAKLQAGAVSPRFMQALIDYMDRFGCRCIREIDIGTPRPYENIPAFFEQLKAINIESELLDTMAQRRQDAYKKLLALATEKGKANKFERQARLLHNAGYRGAPRTYSVIALDLMRKRALVLGREFVSQGRLDRADQVFELTVQQITQAQSDPTLPLAPLVEGNLAPRTKYAHVQEWPRVIDSRGKIYRAEPAPAAEGGLLGNPITPGVVQGKARVLHSPYEKPLNRGEILVTRAADPGWTPLLLNAAGVVLEVGGALQHGAVIAREFGLPCVSGVEGATRVVVDGQLIEVNGTTGVVRILE